MDRICQSCGMPLNVENDYGTNEDMSKNEDYCVYCFKKGKFLFNGTMEEMIDHCVQIMENFNQMAGTNYNSEIAKKEMQEFFPTLKRWKI